MACADLVHRLVSGCATSLNIRRFWLDVRLSSLPCLNDVYLSSLVMENREFCQSRHLSMKFSFDFCQIMMLVH
jgi:hypothetical protein